MNNILTLMSYNSTLLGAIALVGALVYLGALAVDPSHQLLRLIAAYTSGSALVLIGALGFYFGAAYELPLFLLGVYNFDALHMEWIGLGLVAISVGAFFVWQAFHRQ